MRFSPLLVLGIACTAASPPSRGEDRADLELVDVEVHQFRAGERTLSAWTPRLSFRHQGPAPGALATDEVRAEVPGHGLTVFASRVTGNALEGVMHGEQVVAVSDAGSRVASPRATFVRGEGAAGTASTDAGVVVEHPSFRLTASTARYDLALGRAEATGVVSEGRLELDKPGR